MDNKNSRNSESFSNEENERDGGGDVRRSTVHHDKGTLGTLRRATGVSQAEIPKKNPWKNSGNVSNRLFRDFFQTFWDPMASVSGRLFSDFLGLRAQRARETPVARRRVPKEHDSCRKVPTKQ